MTVHQIRVAPSLLIAIAVGASHLLAGVLLWLAPIPVAGRALFAFAIAASLVYFMARDALLHAADSIVALEIRERGGIACRTRRGDWHECDLLGSTFVSPLVTVVGLRPTGRRRTRHVVLVPDNVQRDEFRRLRVWLRWKGSGSGDIDPGPIR
jgi:toxin CptA